MNLAATSATLSAPFAITRNCTIVIIIKTTAPTIKFPSTTKSAKALITLGISLPARTLLVVEMFNESLKIVQSNKTVGREVKRPGSCRNIVLTKNKIAKARFKHKKKSSTHAGRGIIITPSMPIIKNGTR